MRKLSFMPTFILVFSMILLTAGLIFAQQRGADRPNQPRDRQFDPEQMMQRRMQQIIENLKLSEEEAAVLKPMIENTQRMRMSQTQETRTLMDNLQKAIDAKDTNKIKSELTALKAKRAEQRAALDKAEKDLIELLTLDQEAALTVMGVVNSDGMGMGFRFGGPPGQGSPGQGPQGGQRGTGGRTGNNAGN